ncbi:hypothetical protein COCC4DRAFT_59152 [Bipolaris maydis ATCC 48331]|uniref:Uncharacterized protein n=1 Tax=Cochliobolus heterostrophus (strain C4 / ATCC 48331 / race T) TaxID=665024 RepID=N4XQB7_COCH4|nr:uncharacterized protein COCC4DRAFT_59152 [Bipolaris maydis ATCC 48331]ENI07332.1 hypothetical protein COCC4DRAFT_59152 [Bipolaris maydis ATCC 48331]
MALLRLRLRLLLAVVLQTLGDAMSRQIADGLTRRPHLDHTMLPSPPSTPPTPATSLLPTLTAATAITLRPAVHRQATAMDMVTDKAVTATATVAVAMAMAIAMEMEMEMAMEMEMEMEMAMAMALHMPVAHGQHPAGLEPVPSASPPC